MSTSQQRFFGRMCRVTVKVTVLTSSTSAVVRLTEILQLAAAVRAGALGRSDHVDRCVRSARATSCGGPAGLWQLAAALNAVSARSASATAAFEFLEGQGHLPAVHLLGGLAEARTAQLRQLELQVFDLLIALAQLDIFGLRSGVMLEDEALKSRLHHPAER